MGVVLGLATPICGLFLSTGLTSFFFLVMGRAGPSEEGGGVGLEEEGEGVTLRSTLFLFFKLTREGSSSSSLTTVGCERGKEGIEGRGEGGRGEGGRGENS